MSGRGRYLDDVEPDGCLHATVLRSTHAHARIRGLDADAALDVPGLVAIYTADDLGGLDAPLPSLGATVGLHHPRTQRPLARDMTRLVGEAIALVVATDRALAEDAAERIAVDYEPLPVVASLDDAAAAEALVHDDVPGNLAGEISQVRGDPDGALAAAPHRLELRVRVERSAGMPIETRGVVALPTPEGGVTVFDSTQAPATVRLGLAALLDLPEHRVEVVAPDIGGGFGAKIDYWYPEEVLVPFAALALGRPVKWVEDRREHFVATNHERGQVHDVRVGFDDDGRILALEDRFEHDAGAYVPYGIVVPMVTASRLPGAYRIPDLRIELRSLYTNTVPTTPYRGGGQPHATFVIERTVDAVARHLDLDRVEVRRRNLLAPGDYPYEPGTLDEDGSEVRYDSGNVPAAMDLALELLGAADAEAERPGAERRGRRVGFGVGTYVESTGGTLFECARVAIEPSGRVLVAAPSSTQGQGHVTTLAQVAAHVLGARLDDVDVITGDTRLARHGTGTFGSRIAVIAGNAVAKAAAAVRAKAIAVAARALEAAPEELEVDEAGVHVRSSPGAAKSFGELATLANPLQGGDAGILEVLDGPGLEATEVYAPARPVYASGAHAALVEIDPETFELRILRYAAVRDCGRTINPTIADGQILGGVAQGIGGAYYERLAYDAGGQLVNASFMDFLMPFATEVPEMRVGSIETLSPENPLGVKGTGQGGVMPVAAVVVSAIEDALGLPLLEAPLSPDRLFELTREGATRQEARSC